MMIRLLVIGVWVCIVTLLSSYAAVVLKAPHAHSQDAHDAHDTPPEVRATIKLRMLSVPIIHEGEHQGYVVAQFTVLADAALARRYASMAELVITDEAFKTIYGEDDVDFRKLRKQDLTKITSAIAANVNKRIGANLVEEALVQELNYVPKNEIRNGPKK
jgi:hypothetical protein